MTASDGGQQIVPAEVHRRFIDTDLTYAGCGYVERHGGANRPLGEETRNGIWADKL